MDNKEHLFILHYCRSPPPTNNGRCKMDGDKYADQIATRAGLFLSSIGVVQHETLARKPLFGGGGRVSCGWRQRGDDQPTQVCVSGQSSGVIFGIISIGCLTATPHRPQSV